MQKSETVNGSIHTVTAPVQHGKLYWAFRHFLEGSWKMALRHKLVSTISVTTTLWLLFVFRYWWQPFIVTGRVHTPETIVVIILLIALYGSMSWKTWKRFLFVVSTTTLLVLMHLKMELPPLRWVTLYLRYNALNPVVINQLPLTDHERIQPQPSIKVLGSEAMKEVEQVSDPDFVRLGDEFRWTMAIEPTYNVPKTIGHVKEVLSVSGLASSPNFSGENRIAVSFPVGEDLYFGKRAVNAVIRSLGFFRFFSYSPRDVKFVKDDAGEWVEVVSLIRWRGVIFVWPEFGGVQVIRQGDDDIVWNTKRMVRSWFFGDGEWISPEEIHKHRFLEEQNTVPYEVSRYTAQSLRFQAGFLTVMPHYHKGDIRIPDIVEDQNSQPFTAYFRMGEVTKSSSDDKLYHYFALEPYHDTKQGLNTSVFIPADGMGPVRVYRHFQVNEALTGVSAISAKVMESRKEYDWEQSRPVEHRPWVKDIDGKRRFFWLTTVVTYKDKKQLGNPAFIAGSTPALTLTDALYKNVVWVNPHEPTKWAEEVKSKLEVVWKSN